MTAKDKIISDIEEIKSAIADADTPTDMKETLSKALANMEAKLIAIEKSERKVQNAEKKASAKEKKPKKQKMQIRVGEKNLDEATYDEILEKFNERRNTSKTLVVKAKTKSPFTVVADKKEQSLEANK